MLLKKVNENNEHEIKWWKQIIKGNMICPSTPWCVSIQGCGDNARQSR